MISNSLTIVGNLVDDPELRFTQSGKAVATFRIASTPRYYDKTEGEWVDGDPVFMTIQKWGERETENLVESVGRGDRVVVIGQLKQRSYETKEGEQRTVYEVTADEIAVSLQFRTVKIQKDRVAQKNSNRRDREERVDDRPSRKAREGANSRQASRAADRDSRSRNRGSEDDAGTRYSDEPPF